MYVYTQLYEQAYMLSLPSRWTLGYGTPTASSHLLGWGRRNPLHHEARWSQLPSAAIITEWFFSCCVSLGVGNRLFNIIINDPEISADETSRYYNK